MSTAELKLSLHQLIEGTSDNSVLQKVFEILAKSSKKDDWWENLTDESKEKTKKSLEQLKNGNVTSHKKAMEQLAKKYPQLKF